MKRLALAALTTLWTAASASAAEVAVRVSGVADGVGQIRVAACTEAEFLKECRLTASAPARAGIVTVTLRSVPPGSYAIQAFHDRDGDGRLATNMVGLPAEPYGFSRAPPIRFGPPSFGSAAVVIDGRPQTVPVALSR